MMNKALVGVVVLLFTISPVHAMQTEEYLNHVTDLVYDSCKGNDIKLKDNFFIRADNSGFVTELNWPYNKELINATIHYISRSEPYSASNNMYNGGNIEVGNKSVLIDNRGENILTCGENHLDAYIREYYWNTRKIELPRNIQVNEGGKATFGDRSPIIDANNSQITTGDNSPINQENIFIQLFWSKGTVGGIIIALVLTIISYILKKRIKKKSK